MKVIHFELTVPDWACWLTVDKFGVVECWARKPRTTDWSDPGRWNFGGRRKELVAFTSQSYRGWKQSLRRVKR